MSTGYAAPRNPLPLGVGILAILIGILGAIFLVGSILLFIVLLLGKGFAPQLLPLFGVGLIAAVVLLVFGIVLLVVASGLWHLEMWALVLSFIVIGIAWVSDVLQGQVLSLSAIVLLVLLIYLFLVRNHFR